MSYKQAFGQDFDLGFDLESFPVKLIDRSYGNDVCPSFYFSAGGEYFVLWVENKDPEKRESEQSKRYTISPAKEEDGEVVVDYSKDDVFYSENEDNLEKFITEKNVKHV